MAEGPIFVVISLGKKMRLTDANWLANFWGKCAVPEVTPSNAADVRTPGSIHPERTAEGSDRREVSGYT